MPFGSRTSQWVAIATRGGTEPVLALDLRVDPFEDGEVAVDRRVGLARLHEEDDDVGDLPLELEQDRRHGVLRGVGLGRLRAFLHPARVQNGDRPARGDVIEPLAAPGLRLHVADVGDVRAEERIDHGGLARATASDESERWRALLEEDRAQKRDLGADVGHGGRR